MNMMPVGSKALAADFLEITIECVFVGSKDTWAGGEACSNLARLSTPIAPAPTRIMVTRVSAAFNERALVPNQACNVFEKMFVVMKDHAACPRPLLIRCCCFNYNESRHMDGDSCNELTQSTQLKLKETMHFRIETVYTNLVS